jgi:iron(III) transport system substrate-binding protein
MERPDEARLQGQDRHAESCSSGTGFLDISGWIQMWGEADAWKFMDALHGNIGVYTVQVAAVQQAGAGEFPIGVSFEYRAMATKKPARRST